MGQEAHSFPVLAVITETSPGFPSNSAKSPGRVTFAMKAPSCCLMTRKILGQVLTRFLARTTWFLFELANKKSLRPHSRTVKRSCGVRAIAVLPLIATQPRAATAAIHSTSGVLAPKWSLWLSTVLPLARRKSRKVGEARSRSTKKVGSGGSSVGDRPPDLFVR